MNHEYRESPYSLGICAGCGRSFSRCRGLKLRPMLSFRPPLDLAAVDAALAPSWDEWCERYGVDPNTPDETLLDDYLHGRTPPPLACPPRLSDQAWTEVRELERWARM